MKKLDADNIDDPQVRKVLQQWPPMKDHIVCDCLLTHAYFFGWHFKSEHDKERCSGSWGWDPPCGGCINCLLAQVHYYLARDREIWEKLPRWKKLVTAKPSVENYGRPRANLGDRLARLARRLQRRARTQL